MTANFGNQPDPQAANHNPQLLNAPATAVALGNTYSYHAEVFDADGDTPVFSLTQKPGTDKGSDPGQTRVFQYLQRG